MSSPRTLSNIIDNALSAAGICAMLAKLAEEKGCPDVAVAYRTSAAMLRHVAAGEQPLALASPRRSRPPEPAQRGAAGPAPMRPKTDGDLASVGSARRQAFERNAP